MLFTFSYSGAMKGILITGSTKFSTANDSIKHNFHDKFLAMSAGNIMEWYDFAIFGSLADIIGNNFFPPSSENMNLLKSLSVFGAAFFTRPLGTSIAISLSLYQICLFTKDDMIAGGALLGYIGDKFGRKIALEISVLLMLIPSVLMGCLPTFHSFGYSATFLLVFAQ